MQAHIADRFAAHGLSCLREYRLSPRDRVDFFDEAKGCAIEVKLKANRRSILRQLTRYAEHDAVKTIVLVSGTAMALPPAIDGVPLYFVSVGRAWL